MKAKFIGQVRGYSVDEQNNVHLMVDDTEISEVARIYVRDLGRNFDPKSGEHGFGAKEKLCNIRPGFAMYSFVMSQEKAQGIPFGASVEIEVDIFLVRNVRYYNKRWCGIPDLRYELVSIRLHDDKRIDAITIPKTDLATSSKK